MSEFTEYIEFEDARLIRSTDNAGLFRIDGNDYWIPWSQISDDSIDRDGQVGSLFITEWIAEKKGLQ